MAVVDDHGDRVARIPTQLSAGLEIPRGDLAAVLAAAAGEHATFVHDETVTALHDDGHGVDITFHRGPPRRFDLVVGADGLHSRVRKLMFGPESRYVTHLGLCAVSTTLPGPHARGARAEVVPHAGPAGTTPARAGSTLADQHRFSRIRSG